MARGTGKKKGKKKGQNGADGNSSSQQQQQQQQEDGFIWVDPSRVRFQHSRIRPRFSGCGRSIYETLESIRKKEMSPLDLPAIQVIVGPKSEEGLPWYFGLNNRRLWVLKRCREEGLLENDLIKVRVRTPKSSAEAARYSLENCAFEAKIVKEGSGGDGGSKKNGGGARQQNTDEDETTTELSQQPQEKVSANPGESESCSTEIKTERQQLDNTNDLDSDDDSDDGDDDDDVFASKNPFSALL